MQEYDWSRFLLRIPVRADREKIFAAWCSQQGLESWFLREASFQDPEGNARNPNEPIQVKDTYLWRWHGWPDDVMEKGLIIESNGNDRLKFSFGKAGNVTISIREDNGETILELLQDEIPDTDEGRRYYHLGCTKGWVFYLANLKSILEGGLDLRNRNINLKEVVSS